MMTHDVAVICCNVSNRNICSPGYMYLEQSLGVFLGILNSIDWNSQKLGHFVRRDNIFS